MKHLGFLPLSSIYHELKLDQFLINRQRSRAMDYSLNDVMQLLVYTRILSPGSKRHSFAQRAPTIATRTMFIVHWITLTSSGKTFSCIYTSKSESTTNAGQASFSTMSPTTISRLTKRMTFGERDSASITHVTPWPRWDSFWTRMPSRLRIYLAP
jgi:hypothetical protein